MGLDKPATQAKINQYALIGATLKKKCAIISEAIFGTRKVSPQDFSVAVNELKDVCKQLDGAIQKNEWLVVKSLLMGCLVEDAQ